MSEKKKISANDLSKQKSKSPPGESVSAFLLSYTCGIRTQRGCYQSCAECQSLGRGCGNAREATMSKPEGVLSLGQTWERETHKS